MARRLDRGALAEGVTLAGTWFDRAGLWHAQQQRKKYDPEINPRDFKEIYTLELSPLPCLAETSEANHRLFVQGLIAEIVEEFAATRTGSMMGVAAVCRQHPRSMPNVQRSPAPWVRAASREARLDFRRAFGEYVRAYRDAATRQKFGLHIPRESDHRFHVNLITDST